MTEAQLLAWCEGTQPSKPVTVTLSALCDFVGNIYRVLNVVAGSGVALTTHFRSVEEAFGGNLGNGGGDDGDDGGGSSNDDDDDDDDDDSNDGDDDSNDDDGDE
jgi:hypothetical protein